jgi:hypothetical protein
MTKDEDTFEIADREKREFAERSIAQIAKTRVVGPRPFASDVSTQEAIAALALSVAHAKQSPMRDPVSRDSRDVMIDDLIDRVDRQSRRIDSLELDIVALRSSQPVGDPSGAHPYRSAAQTATAAPSSPVVTSEAAPTSSSASGALRRVYGALASQWPFVGAAAGFAYASVETFAWSPSVSGALGGVALVALVRICIWAVVR